MLLVKQVNHFFAADGELAQSLSSYRPRLAQQQIAADIATAIEKNTTLIIEAGTGVGKTFAYLVPALLSGKKTLVSTASKNLQDQLFNKDLPQLLALLQRPISLALLKGRTSYLCLYRLELFETELDFGAPEQTNIVWQLKQWATVSRDGDLASYPGKNINALHSKITSNYESCLGSSCPEYRNCFVYKARRRAMAADLVVINHHLFFADVALQRAAASELLPTFELLIFDEAHQLNDTGVQFLGRSISSTKLIALANDVLDSGARLAAGLQDWQRLSKTLEQAAKSWRLSFPLGFKNARLSWLQLAPQGVDETRWLQSLTAVAQALELLLQSLMLMQLQHAEFAKLLQRAQEQLETVQIFLRPANADVVRWLELGEVMQAVQSPLDITGVFNQLLQPPTAQPDLSEQLEPPKSLIFTSATLGNDAELNWFRNFSGIDVNLASARQANSPFNYASQAKLYIPEDFPLPSAPQHSQQVAELVLQAASYINGATLVLTTSLRAMQAIAAWLKQRQQSDALNFEVWQQNDLPKYKLLEKFRQAGQTTTTKGMVLVASQSFWQGVDVIGDALRLVVIDKLPFPAPEDPLISARLERLKLQKKNSFKDYMLPEAAVALKQGAGRLIRHEDDRGILVVADGRLRSANYGKSLVASLPAMQQLHSKAQFIEELEKLADYNSDPSA